MFINVSSSCIGDIWTMSSDVPSSAPKLMFAAFAASKVSLACPFLLFRYT
jgi:hypothetical protein